MSEGGTLRSKKSLFSGWLQLKAAQDKDYRKYFAKLIGKEIWLFSNSSATHQSQIEDKIVLCNVVEVSKHDENRILGRITSPPHVTLTFKADFKNKNMKIRTETADELTSWYRYLHTVALLQVPPGVKDLLPGQQQEFQDILAEVVLPLPTYEESCITPQSPPPYPDVFQQGQNGNNCVFSQNDDVVYLPMKALPLRKTSLPVNLTLKSEAHSTQQNQANDVSLAPPVPQRQPQNSPLTRGFSSSSADFVSNEKEFSKLKKQVSESALDLPPRRPPKPGSPFLAKHSPTFRQPTIPEELPAIDGSEAERLRQNVQVQKPSINDFSQPPVPNPNRRMSAPLPDAPPIHRPSSKTPLSPSGPSGFAPDLRQPVPSSGYGWFVDRELSRQQAEKFLEQNNESGNMIMRIRVRKNDKDPWTHAVSIRLSAPSIGYKHYLVREGPGDNVNYIINLDGIPHTPIYTLEGVMTYFQTESRGEFKPLSNVSSAQDNLYDDCIPGQKKTIEENTYEL